MCILKIEFFVVYDLCIFLESFLELFPDLSEIKIVPVATEAELLLSVLKEEDIVVQKGKESSEVIGPFLLGVKYFFVDEPFNKGVDESFKEEGVSETGQEARDLPVDPPHSIGQERLG